MGLFIGVTGECELSWIPNQRLTFSSAIHYSNISDQFSATVDLIEAI